MPLKFSHATACSTLMFFCTVTAPLMGSASGDAGGRLHEEVQGEWVYLENRCLQGGQSMQVDKFVGSSVEFAGNLVNYRDFKTDPGEPACMCTSRGTFQAGGDVIANFDTLDTCGRSVVSFSIKVVVQGNELNFFNFWPVTTCGGGGLSKTTYVLVRLTTPTS